MVRDSIPQRAYKLQRSDMNLNAALELPLSQTHLVFRDSIPQRVSNCLRSRYESQHCAGATFVLDTFRDQRKYSPTISHWITCWLRNTTLHWSSFCLRRLPWSEVAFPNTLDMINFDRERNTALGLLLHQFPYVIRGSIPQRVSNWKTDESSTICTGIIAFPNTRDDQRWNSQTHLYMTTSWQLSSKLLRRQIGFYDESKSTSLRWCTNVQRRRTIICHVQALRWDFQSHGRNM